MLLITILSFPFSLYMPLITTFSSWLWLCWSLITAFLPVPWLGGNLEGENKKLWGDNYVIQASELHGCQFPGSLCHIQTMTDGNAPCFTNYSFIFQYASSTNHLGMYKIDNHIIKNTIK